MVSELAVYVPQPFDIALPATERVEMARDLCAHVAEQIVSREEHDDSPWVPQQGDTEEDLKQKRVLRQQEIDRREMQVITYTTNVWNLAAMRWVLEHGDDKWIGANGEADSFQIALEKMMPNEDQRASSGRARDLAAFYERSVPEFRKLDIGDEDIARAYTQGHTTYLGHVAAAQKAVLESEPDIESRREKYLGLIGAAEVAQSAYSLKRELTRIIGGEETSEEIFYTLENDGDQVWVILHMDRDLFVYRVLDKLRETLVPSIESLAEWFSQFWEAQKG